MIRSILVPLDGSTFGEHALPTALALASRGRASLQLVHVHQVVPPATVAGVAVMDDLEMTMRNEERAYLDGLTRKLREMHPEIEISGVLIEGDVAGALQEQARELGADLVVLSTHARGVFGRFWLGSVTDEVVRMVQTPVLLVRPGSGAVDYAQEPILHRLLLPLDGTLEAEQVLAPAMQLGEVLGAEFTLVRVIKPAVRFDYLPEGGTLDGMTQTALHDIEERQRHQEQEARSYLEGVAARLRARGNLVQVRVVVDEQPAMGILREAEVHEADLVAMETHGRRGLTRLMLGSVADKVIRGGSVPVLLHRFVHA